MKEQDLDLSEALKIVSDFGGRREKKSEEERLKVMLKGKDISEVVNLMLNTGDSYNKRILRFFRWFCKWIPIAIMLTHWYGLYDFSQPPRDMFLLDSGNTSCYLWIYFMAYVLPMVIIAASRFFFLCWRYRIPFFYFFGVNAMHLCYWSIFTTNDMVMPHFCLMAMILMMYAYGFGEMVLNTRLVKRVF